MGHLPETERIRAIRSLHRENRIQDALALLEPQAKVRLDLSEETREHLLHLEAECHHGSGEFARAVELDPKNRVARLGKTKIEQQFELSDEK